LRAVVGSCSISEPLIRGGSGTISGTSSILLGEKCYVSVWLSACDGRGIRAAPGADYYVDRWASGKCCLRNVDMAAARSHLLTLYDVGVWLDIMKWTRIAENRKNIPGFSEKPAEAVPASVDTPPAETSTSDELEKLAGLRDQGVITEEEFEAKKKQLLGL
jgi:hypothetical protein